MPVAALVSALLSYQHSAADTDTNPAAAAGRGGPASGASGVALVGSHRSAYQELSIFIVAGGFGSGRRCGHAGGVGHWPWPRVNAGI